jgi:hypothetical protein
MMLSPISAGFSILSALVSLGSWGGGAGADAWAVEVPTQPRPFFYAEIPELENGRRIDGYYFSAQPYHDEWFELFGKYQVNTWMYAIELLLYGRPENSAVTVIESCARFGRNPGSEILTKFLQNSVELDHKILRLLGAAVDQKTPTTFRRSAITLGR